jgi:hypothetical protein
MQPSAGKLTELRIAPLSLRVETTGPIRGPEFKGDLFRGGFGEFFRDQVCVTPAGLYGMPPRERLRLLYGI